MTTRYIFSILLALLGFYPLHSTEKPDRGVLRYNQEVLKHTEQWAVDHLYDTLEVIDELCRKHDIPYTVLSGTLLGSLRDGGLIRWDDDGDIGMLEDDYAKFLELEHELNMRGYEITPSIWKGITWGHYVYPKEGVPGAHNKKYPAVDIFPMKLLDSTYHYAVEEARKAWKLEYFTPTEWNQITDIPFGHLTLRGPAVDGATSYCSRVYGSDWDSVAVVWWDHKDDRSVQSEYVRLEEHIHAKRTARTHH